MKPTELLALLQDFYRERLALFDRHVKGAQAVADYEINNTYQYIIVREETHLTWLRTALVDLGGDVPAEFQALAVPARGAGEPRQHAVIEDDLQQQRDFVERWTPRVEAITHARHRNMLKVVLGEALEHRRFFEQALAGRDDLLGRRRGGATTGGGVLPVRWVE
ncbi:MAG: hypothetical protein GEU99_06860 [Luteitalea sp.]|nr:hypothetical protein [Luteitalea sp.]